MCRRPFPTWVRAAPATAAELSPDRRHRVDGSLVMLTAKRREAASERETSVVLPCGRCDECVEARAGFWRTRCLHEWKSHEAAGRASCMVTLTYHRPFLPRAAGAPAELGDSAASLWEPHLVEFLARLRRRLYDESKRRGLLSGGRKFRGFRYFAGAEYGGKRGRPHFHVLLFGFVPDDLVKVGSGEEYGDGRQPTEFFRSALLDACWSELLAPTDRRVAVSRAVVHRHGGTFVLGEEGSRVRCLLGEVTVSRWSDATASYATGYTMAKKSLASDPWVGFPWRHVSQRRRRAPDPAFYGFVDPEFVAVKSETGGDESWLDLWRASPECEASRWLNGRRTGLVPTWTVGPGGIWSGRRWSFQWSREAASAELRCEASALVPVRAEHLRRADPRSEVGWSWVCRDVEFQRMSRNPGLGAAFAAKFGDELMAADGALPHPVPEAREGKVPTLPLPRFYLDLWSRREPEKFGELLERRRVKRAESREAALVRMRKALRVEAERYAHAVASGDVPSMVPWTDGDPDDEPMLTRFLEHERRVRREVRARKAKSLGKRSVAERRLDL